MLLELLKPYANVTNRMEASVKIIKEHEKKTFVLGGENAARKAVTYLQDNGVDIAGVVVNRKYWQPGKVLCGYAVQVLEDVLSEQATCNVFIGFRGYKETMKDAWPDGVEVYAADVIGEMPIGDYDPVSYHILESRRDELEALEEHLVDRKSLEHLAAFLRQRMTGEYEKDVYEKPAYFPEDIIQLTNHESFVDCGAYTGDTIQDFLQALERRSLHGYEHIYAFEAGRENFAELERSTRNLPQVSLYEKAVGKENGEVRFSLPSGMMGQVIDAEAAQGADDAVSMVSMDTELQGRKISFVKMDIEGTELEALQGARHIIEEQKPRLAICIYHHAYDFLDIAGYLLRLVPEYRLAIRNHAESGTESILYAMR